MTCKESMRGGMGLSGNLFGPEPQKGPVECLGMTFPDDAARRAHFLKRLRSALEELHSVLGVPFSGVEDAVARLKSLQNWPLPEDDRLHALAERMRRGDPGKSLLERWKDEVGFPRGDIEDILRLSDPPYYTACPNPFLAEFVRHYGKPYNPEELYHREPFAVDVSEGKTDPIYTAHSYHTKVPPRAIVRALLHYTEPGDLVLDGFAGSGMTGVAAQMCGHPDPQFKATVEAEWKAAGRGAPRWGARRAILNDLSPLATFLAAGYNLPFDVQEFEREARRILKEVGDELGWMYETRHTDGKGTGRINYTVWSEVFGCPECGGEVVFLKQALNPTTKRVRERFSCPSCLASLTKKKLARSFETLLDPADSIPWKRVRFVPVLINYSLGRRKFEKEPDHEDQERLDKIARMPLPETMPTDGFPIDQMYHGSRLAPKGFTRVHHLFLPRAAQALGALWAKAAAVEDVRLRHMLLFFVEQAVWNLTVLNAYRPTGFSQNSQWFKGIYYVPSQHSECNPWYCLDGKLERLLETFRSWSSSAIAYATVSAGHALPLLSNSVDYIFTDPPFGENIYYADLNFLLESWHRVFTNAAPEAIIDQAKKKELRDYQRLMQRCFEEYYRVLKPGRWMTVVFHNSWNAVWNAIQEAMMAAGFVVADVRTMDKKQGSYRQVTSTAVKQDLVISAYKPNEGLERRFSLEKGQAEGAWDFIRAHLRQLPVFLPTRDGRSDIIVERLPYLLFDRMVAFHVVRGVSVPLSASDFYAGLARRFSERDGMYFLPEQVAEYDKRRLETREPTQLELFIKDESTLIQWLRQELAHEPMTYSELFTRFKKAPGVWDKHEKPLELKDVLSENFLCYEGKGPIPLQIVSWMKRSERWRSRILSLEAALGEIPPAGLETSDAELLQEAKGRWYVPDPARAADLEKLREKALLKEFATYLDARQKKLKVLRLEVVRAGFKKAFSERDYQTIVDVARKIPESVLNEDPKLLMWYDQASVRLGEE